MPLPKPRNNENRGEFRARCMADPTMQNEYPDDEQRMAVCQAQLDADDKRRETGEPGAAEMAVVFTDAFELAHNGGAPDSIWIANVGTYHHPQKGKFTLSEERMRSMVDAFNEQVQRGRTNPVPIDIDHASVREPAGPLRRAMGWLTSLLFDGKTLRGKVEWTDEGQKLVASKGFRYTSPVVLMNHEDTATGEMIPALLHSVALTNQPVLPDGEPIVASQKFSHDLIPVCKAAPEPTGNTPDEGDKKMDLTLSIDGADVEITAPEDKAEEIKALADKAAKVAELEAELAALKAENAEAVEKAEALAASQVPEGAIVLAREEVDTLRTEAKAGALALERLTKVEAESRIELAISQGRMTKAMVTDEIREMAKDESQWGIVLSLRPENSAWEPGVRGINTPEPPAQDGNPLSAAEKAIDAYAEKEGVSFSTALERIGAGAAIDDNTRSALVAAGYIRG